MVDNEKFYIEFDEAVRGKYVIINRENFNEAIRVLKEHAYTQASYDAQDPRSPDDAIAFDCAVIIKLLGGQLDK